MIYDSVNVCFIYFPSNISSDPDPVINPKLHFQIAFWFYGISNCNPFWYKCLYTFHIIFKFCVQKNIFVALNNDVKFSGSLLPAVSERVYCAWKVPLAEPVNKYLFLWEKANFQYLSAHLFLRSLSKVIEFAGLSNDVKVSAQPTFQRRINVVSMLWINVEITLIRRWKWNKIRRRIFNVAQRWYNFEATLKQRCSTLVQCWYNDVST